uniref:Uncharacterized protein n=2 Tax=Oryza punctata TaxID=4537 RepID=A0A0E0K9R2_ORYPU
MREGSQPSHQQIPYIACHYFEAGLTVWYVKLVGMSKSCGGHRDTCDHHLDHCKFIEATRTLEEECILGTQVSNNTISRNFKNMLLSSQVLADNFTDEANKDQYICNSDLQAANRESKKKNLTFLTKFQNRIIAPLASESSPCRNSFHRPLLSREIVVREYVKLARIIRRIAAACFSPSSDAADEDYDYPPHMQLDKVTHAISREEFGPLYLVT